MIQRHKVMMLPKYLTDDDGNRYMLMIVSDVTGMWTAQYENDVGPRSLPRYSIEAALGELAEAYEQMCPLCMAWPMKVLCNNAGCS